MAERKLFAGIATFSLAALMISTHAFAANKPQYGAWGFDAGGMDKDVSPGDSFADFANGNWTKATEIPADLPRWGAAPALADLSDQRVRTILEELASADHVSGSDEQKLGDFYASFLDEATIEAKGMAPLQPWLDEIAAIKTTSDLARILGKANWRYGEARRYDFITTMPVGIGVALDWKDSSLYAVTIGQGGLGLPDRDYYLDDENSKFAEVQEKYRHHIAAMLRLANISEPEARARRIYDLETKIAEAHWTSVEQRDREKLYNPMHKADLAKLMPGFDYEAWLEAGGVGAQTRFIVNQPSLLTRVAGLVQSEPLEIWKDYLTFHALSASAPLLSKAFVEEDFAFNGAVINGTTQIKERWKRGVDLINGDGDTGGGMGDAAGKIYVARYFPPEAKAKMDRLIQNLLAAMDRHLTTLTWMTPEVRAKARVKLAAFTAKTGYPDTWRDYSALRIMRDDAYGNAQRAAAFEYQRNLDRLGKPVDRREWTTLPQTVNAFANSSLNDIVFPAAILQPPFFDPNADDAVNYGAIGMAIGHEISHHFDDQGSKVDDRGNLHSWWTHRDFKRFKALTDKVVKQYGEYEPLPGVKVNGELTLGENIADLAGLAIAYDAYQLSLGGKPAPIIDGYSGDQRFFLGFAQIWRSKYRDAFLRQWLASNNHTPNYLRPNVVRNFDAWYKAFGIKSGKLYLPRKQRIKIW